MSDNLKLEKGQEVTLNVGFVYTIGEEGAVTGNMLETLEDCKNDSMPDYKYTVVYYLKGKPRRELTGKTYQEAHAFQRGLLLCNDCESAVLETTNINEEA